VRAVPPLPPCVLTDPHDEETLPRLIEALQDRHRARQTTLQQCRRAADTFVSMLQQLDSDLVSKEATIHQQNAKLAEKDAVVQNNSGHIESLRQKIKVHEEKIDDLQKTNALCEDDLNLLQQELQAREQRLQQELSDRRRMERRLQGRMEDTKLKWEKECERRLNAVQVEMQRRLLAKEETLKQVKAVLEDSQTLHSPRLSPQMQSSSSQEVLCEQSPDSLSLPCVCSGPTHNSPLVSFNATEEPPNIPVRPLHRRFSSPGQKKWVDHKPPSNLDLGTMMQPVIPNAIEVSSPSEKALAKCDKYVLTHQELASDDEIHTHLIKGEIIKTRGGGQAVQFTDIETLKQEL
ncbi:unnamed protein product, partial [Tetraodon nigroviridis]